MTLRYLIAGESHGKGITVILEGMPSNVPININEINRELAERQQGFGRGSRQKIEKDKAQVLSGLRFGKTLGSPLAFFIENKDFKNWKKEMNAEYAISGVKPVTLPRPGHADLAGALKYNFKDIRNVLEKASARDTVARVIIGSVCKQFLKNFKISFEHHIVSVGPINVNKKELTLAAKQAILEAKNKKTTIGGTYRVIIKNVPVGLGSYVAPDRKLDSRLAAALMGIQAHKGVEIGLGFAASKLTGKEALDAIVKKGNKIVHATNHAGGIEGGMSNGENIIVRAAVKPIPTMLDPLPSVDIKTGKVAKAHFERSDICPIESAALIGENTTAFEITKAFLEKFGGDSLEEIKNHVSSF